jgi:sphinganine-1-phosphate aldolase
MGYFGSDAEVVFDERVFPPGGWSRDDVMRQLAGFESQDVDDIHAHNTIQSTTLMSHMEAAQIGKEAHQMFLRRNMLYKSLLPGTTRMAIEVQQMIREMLHYPQDARIRFTSGGSESLYCAIHSARQWGRQVKDIERPEIVVPYSIHAAFSKWCTYADIKINRVPLGPDYRADVDAMARVINDNTVLIAGSAPCWPYGLFDDIEGLADLARRHDIWMHVDGCLGGFQSPFAEQLGHPIPVWDFRLPGVRSISADLHKHAYSSKPLSSIAFRTEEWEQYLDCPAADWPDGPYTSEAICGTTTAGPIASAWAVMKFLGEEGYLDLMRRSLAVRQRYIAGLSDIDGVEPFVSDMCVMTIRPEKGLDLFAIMGGLFERQSFCLPSMQPPALKIVLDPVTDEVVDTFLADLADVIPRVRSGEITIESIQPYM